MSNKFKSLIILCLLLSSCTYGWKSVIMNPPLVNKRTTNFDLLEDSPILSENEYDCILIADSHFGKKDYDKHQKDFFEWLDEYYNGTKQPAMCIFLGDVVDHGEQEEYKKFEAFQKKIQDKYNNIKIFNVVGNHDLYNSGWYRWKKACKPHKSAYYFRTKEFEWYFADTGNGTLGKKQLQDLKNKFQSSNRPKLFFTHYPLNPNIMYYNISNSVERAELLSLFLNNNLKLYCSGHYHYNRYYNYGSFKEYNVSAFGQKKQWHILHINEEKRTFKIETFSK